MPSIRRASPEGGRGRGGKRSRIMPLQRLFLGKVFPDAEIDICLPMEFDASSHANHGGHNLTAIGRLKANTSIEQASADLKRIARQLETSYPDSNQGWSVLLTPVREQMVGEFRQALLVLWGAVGFVLLIACANIANLFSLGRFPVSAMLPSGLRLARRVFGLHVNSSQKPSCSPCSEERSVCFWHVGECTLLSLCWTSQC